MAKRESASDSAAEAEAVTPAESVTPEAEAEPTDAEPTQDAEAKPTQQSKDGGETEYSVDRLVAESDAFLGVPPHVAAGAFHGQEQEYWTVEAGKARVAEWQETPVKTSEEIAEEQKEVT